MDYLAVSAFDHVHVLRAVAGTTRFDGLWLETLPRDVPPPGHSEISKGLVLRSKTQFTLDESRHYQFPWMLLTTVDAYRNGSAPQKARAVLWVEAALSHPLTADGHSLRAYHGRSLDRAAARAGKNRRKIERATRVLRNRTDGKPDRREPPRFRSRAGTRRPSPGTARASRRRYSPCRSARDRACAPSARTDSGCRASACCGPDRARRRS